MLLGKGLRRPTENKDPTGTETKHMDNVEFTKHIKCNSKWKFIPWDGNTVLSLLCVNVIIFHPFCFWVQ